GELGYGIVSEDLGGGADLEGLTTGGIYAKAGLPLGSQFEIFGRAGLGFQELEVSGGGAPTTFGSESGFAFGGGASFDISETIYIRGDYTRVALDGVDIDEIGVSLGFRF
ncbi:MAG: outer membrane beta-barrel protein, partial [Pseudomonadota bacterium]